MINSAISSTDILYLRFTKLCLERMHLLLSLLTKQ